MTRDDMTDRELLELAAKAAGMEYIKPAEGYDGCLGLEVGNNPMRTQSWNPLKNDGDALRLAVKLKMCLKRHYFEGEYYVMASHDAGWSQENIKSDPYAATRRAIVRAAAEIGRNDK